MRSLPRKFEDLQGKVCLITGAAGLLGCEFTEAMLEVGAKVCMLDINAVVLRKKATLFAKKFKNKCMAVPVDITDEKSLEEARVVILKRFGRIDVLINNAANNPKVEKGGRTNFSRFENFPVTQWEKDLAVSLKGAFLCCKIFGGIMAKNKKGVILNIASDLSVIAPDQRIYKEAGLPADMQPVKPVTYSVAKTGLVGLTRYLATYWAQKNVRVNALSPGGVYTGQPEKFVKRLTELIPMGRMAEVREYRQAVIFLCCDASRYMTGQNVVMDGGRSTW